MPGVIGLVIVIVLIVILALVIAGIYNGLVTLRNRVDSAWAQIDVQLKRRYDLIPNLVETVKGYLKHEHDTLVELTRARGAAMAANQAASANPGNPDAMKAMASAEAGLAGALSKIMVVSENYPDLKASQNMAQLTEELTSTENKVGFSRQAYNDSVTTYNTERETFPAVLFAAALGFGEAHLWELESKAEREAPQVKF